VANRKWIDRRWWADRLELALDRRAGLFDAQTTGFRWIHGESDGWPGLVLDRYEATLVLKLYSTVWLPRLEEVTKLLIERLQPERLVMRLSRNIQAIAGKVFAKTDGQTLHETSLQKPVIFLETGLRFEADVLRGQKTGFFLDQRENRRRVEMLAGGREVLNAFSFSGGFSVYAARGGARAVTDLDISSHALSSAKRNFSLNQPEHVKGACKQELIQADAFEWLSGNERRKFDLVILDPPSLAKRQTERASALRAYSMLASSGIKHLRPGGILVACSCSAHVVAEDFFRVVRAVASLSGRSFEVLGTTRHAPDHPATFKEAEYLKAIYLRET